MLAVMALLAAFAATPAAAGPSAETTKAFDEYVAKAEDQIRRQESSFEAFVIVEPASSGTRQAALGRGDTIVDHRGPAMAQIPGGLIHHWAGTVFIPGASVAQVLEVVQDYDHLERYYSPEVLASRLVARKGNDFHIVLRMRERKILTVVLDSQFDVRYGRLDADHQFSWSRSTRITEVTDADGPRERALSDAENHGYLWRLNSYWRFVQVDGGAIVQCEAISLTRDVPTGLGWLIGPLVREIPRESLETALRHTRDAVIERARRGDSTATERR